MRRIAFSNAKGGVGKTSSTVSVGAGLALKGRRVLIVDMDSQGQVARSLGMKDREAGLADVFEESVALDEAITPARENLDVIPGGRRLAGVKRLLSRREMRAEMALSEVLDGLDERSYDYVLLDTAPSWDILNINCLFYADELLIPVSMEVLALQGLGDFLSAVRDVQKYRDDLKITGVIPTFFDGRVRKSADVLAQLRTHFGEKVTPVVRYNVRLSEAPAYGETIFEYDKRSNGAADYAALVDHLEGQLDGKEAANG